MLSQDLDAIGETDADLDFIFDILNRVWKIKEVPSDYILGVNRKIKYDDKGEIENVELTMTPYIEGMVDRVMHGRHLGCGWRARHAHHELVAGSSDSNNAAACVSPSNFGINDLLYKAACDRAFARVPHCHT